MNHQISLFSFKLSGKNDGFPRNCVGKNDKFIERNKWKKELFYNLNEPD
jgi:hypothetical protein